jgi:hypothetical protein
LLETRCCTLGHDQRLWRRARTAHTYLDCCAQ